MIKPIWYLFSPQIYVCALPSFLMFSPTQEIILSIFSGRILVVVLPLRS
jgi:hypothetical protein